MPYVKVAPTHSPTGIVLLTLQPQPCHNDLTAAFWVMIPCSLVGESHSLHLLPWRWIQHVFPNQTRHNAIIPQTTT